MSPPEPPPAPKSTPFHEGMEHVRRELWPDLPDGYRRGSVRGASFVDVPAVVCEACGTLVGDTDLHTAWHEGQSRSMASVAADASLGAMAMRPIGGAR